MHARMDIDHFDIGGISALHVIIFAVIALAEISVFEKYAEGLPFAVFDLWPVATDCTNSRTALTLASIDMMLEAKSRQRGRSSAVLFYFF